MVSFTAAVLLLMTDIVFTTVAYDWMISSDVHSTSKADVFSSRVLFSCCVHLYILSLLLFARAGGKLSLSGHNQLDSFALLTFCWLQPSRVELCHVSGCAGSEELAHFLSAGEECVKVGGVGAWLYTNI